MLDEPPSISRCRGYPIKASVSSDEFDEVPFILLYKSFPSPRQFQAFQSFLADHKDTPIPELAHIPFHKRLAVFYQPLDNSGTCWLSEQIRSTFDTKSTAHIYTFNFKSNISTNADTPDCTLPRVLNTTLSYTHSAVAGRHRHINLLSNLNFAANEEDILCNVLRVESGRYT